MGIYVISGGPGTGKTSIITELNKKGFTIIPEAAREIGTNDMRFKGKSVREIDFKEFQKAIFEWQKKKFLSIDKKEITFLDRGFGDTLAYFKLHGLEIPSDQFETAKKFKVSKVFILDFLDFYENDALRTETKEEQELIQKEIIEMYKYLGYKPVIVPFYTLENRVKFR
jgi:predicted ATPase